MFNQEKLVEMYSSVIHHTLHHHGVFSHHQNYGDYFNELYIKLIDLADKFQGDALDDTERGHFVAYAKAGLERQLWQLLKQERQRKREIPLENLCIQQSSDELESELTRIDFLANARRVLEKEDYDFLLVVVDDNWTVSDKAKMLGMSRKTYYQKRSRIIGNLKGMK